MRQNITEIILPVHNQISFLKYFFEKVLTLDIIFSDNFTVTVLDNASTDNTDKFVSECQDRFKNLRYIKNAYNRDFSSSVFRAYEIANQDYIWIINPADTIKFDAIIKIPQLLKTFPDALVFEVSPKERYQIFNKFLNLSNTIYKTSNITDTVIFNAENNIGNRLVHLAPAAALINENKEILFAEESITKVAKDNEFNENLGLFHTLKKNMFFELAYLNSLYMLKDKKLRLKLSDAFYDKQKGIKVLGETKNNLKYRFDFFSGLSFKNKVKFLCLRLF